MQEASLDEIQDRGEMLGRALLQQLRVMYQLRASCPCKIVMNLIILLVLFMSRSLGGEGRTREREREKGRGAEHTRGKHVNH